MPLPNRRQVLSWCLFDFANSSYSAVIAAVIFPVYYATRIVGNEAGLGDLWWGRAVSFSMAVIAATSPFVGGLADFSGIRKKAFFAYTALCVIAVAGFSVLEPGMVAAGFFLIVLANIGMEGGIVFYNSFLPEIAPRQYQGRVSAWGFGVGYAGSILSLIIAVPLVRQGHFPATWLMVAAFFALFSIPSFLFLPGDRRGGINLVEGALKGWRYAWKTFREIWKERASRHFLIAYLVYEDGVNTVIVFSSIFASTTLKFMPSDLIVLYILVQITALIGAFALARPIDYHGPKKIVTGSLVLWTVVSVSAFFITEKDAFFVLAAVAGLGLGTIQAASRAFFAQFIPPERESEYFGVYAMVGKTSAIIGPLVFGSLSVAFGSQRPAILSVALFFLAGLVLLRTVKGGGPNTAGRHD